MEADKNYVCRACADLGDDRPYWDADAQKCVQSCVHNTTNDGVCVKCADIDKDKSFWDGKECVATCPQTADSNNVCRTCEEQNPSEPYWDEVYQSCQFRCLCGAYDHKVF